MSRRGSSPRLYPVGLIRREGSSGATINLEIVRPRPPFMVVRGEGGTGGEGREVATCRRWQRERVGDAA